MVQLIGLKRIPLIPATYLIIQEGGYNLYSTLYLEIHVEKCIRYYTKLNIRGKGSLKLIKNVYKNTSNLSTLHYIQIP